MRYRRLGVTGPRVSVLCLGTMNFGMYVDERQCGQLLDRAVDAGVNLVDTADVYGWGPNVGLCESIIGRYISARPGLRERLVIGTKLYRDMAEWPNSKGLSALHIRRGCEASLRRLRTDYLDLLQFHHVDRRVPVEEVWEAIDTLVRQGKVHRVGSSNFAAWHLVQLQHAARRRSMAGLTSEQSVYNLLNRFVELDVLPACHELELGFLAWSPLCDGLLAGPPEGAGRRGEPRNAAKARRQSTVLAEFYSWCAGYGLRPAEVALAWVIGQPGVTSVICGPRTLQHVDSALASAALELADTQLADLDRIFPPLARPNHFTLT